MTITYVSAANASSCPYPEGCLLFFRGNEISRDISFFVHRAVYFSSLHFYLARTRLGIILETIFSSFAGED